jgi:monothiol glutaredoxin
MSTPEEIQARIAEEIGANPVMIYMKGTPQFPQCGFSGAVVEIFRSLGAPIAAVDVLNEEGYRDGIKQFTKWPTVPQVFVGGKFIGGCDITREMYASGELKRLVDEAVSRK